MFIIPNDHTYLIETLDRFNEVHSSIKSIYEEENRGRIVFLDVQPTRRIYGSLRRD